MTWMKRIKTEKEMELLHNLKKIAVNPSNQCHPCATMKIVFDLLLTVLFLLNPFSLPVLYASEKPDHFTSDRFIFLGTFLEKPIIATITFARGFSAKSKFNYIAEFNGHFTFAGKWHHMKNGNYLETNEPFPLEEIPDFEPCIMRWKEKLKTGAINYDQQEISFLLQFRNLKMMDTMGKSPDFLISSGVADSYLQFQGQQIPGKLIYQKMDLTGYNKLVNNFNHFRYRKFEQFFLKGEDGELFIIWIEEESEKLRDQWVPDRKFLFVDRAGIPTMPGGKLTVRWTKIEREPSPEAQFRNYPSAWEINTSLPDSTDGIIKIQTLAGFYWFNRGMAVVSGITGKKKVSGLAEIIRGE